MRNSKILRGICYITIPILFLILVLSVYYEIKVRNDNSYYQNLDFFNTDNFLKLYMNTLSSESRNLIYNNNNINSIMDSDSSTQICYTKEYNNNPIKNYYYLIIYKNLAITNVELTTKSNSIDKIKNYINDFEGKKANIIKGNIIADSEIISTKALQYFDNFIFDYYSTSSEDENTTITYSVSEEEMTSHTLDESPTSFYSMRKYYTTNIKDFEIYTTYEEKINPTRHYQLYEKFCYLLDRFSKISIPAIPICSVLLLIILIYLIISIGHTKNKEDIDLNDFDKIPLEIIIFILFCVSGIFIIIIDEITKFELNNSTFNLWLSAMATIYIIVYIFCITTFVTIVKRIKSKRFWKTTYTGKLFITLRGIIKKILNKIKSIYNKLKSSTLKMFISWNPTAKVLVAFIIINIIMISLFLAFESFGLFLDCFILFGLLYYIVKLLSEYYLIETHLKNIFEGESVGRLDSNKFSKMYKNIIDYINNIQNGYRDAIEEGIKSEKLKTELITNVSHDIKTPLTSIINYVDLLKRENIENKKANEYIDVLDLKSKRLKKLTEDLVEASKASSGSVKLNVERINIIELIKQTTGEFEDRFKDNKLDVILNLPKENMFICADSRYMYRIIENLFSNISKYALESSRVYIDVELIEEKVKITLKNISKEKLNISAEELIQRFVRGDKSRTTEGSGLGLSISQNLTELQNGKFMLNIDGDLFKVELQFNIDK